MRYTIQLKYTKMCYTFEINCVIQATTATPYQSAHPSHLPFRAVGPIHATRFERTLEFGLAMTQSGLRLFPSVDGKEQISWRHV